MYNVTDNGVQVLEAATLAELVGWLQLVHVSCTSWDERHLLRMRQPRDVHGIITPDHRIEIRLTR